MSAAVAMPASAEPASLLPILREIGDLKRLRSAGRDGSSATRLFRQAWTWLVDGHDADEVALWTTSSALAAARLGDLDGEALSGLGLAEQDAIDVLRAGFDEVAPVLDPGLASRLRATISTRPPPSSRSSLPMFVSALADQPRAGVTCPGRPRIVLQPPENHAEHCLAVAVYGVLLSPGEGAEPATVFLAGLAHHLHNACMPDAGFTGEVLLGSHLERVVRYANELALAELDEPLRRDVEAARSVLPDATTPEGRAFHAADVLDRVLEIGQHLRGAGLTMGEVLGEMSLVHDGPVKPFHDATLARFGLS